MSDDNINKTDGDSCDSSDPCCCSQSDGKSSSGFGRGLKMLLCVLILIAAGVVAANAVINGNPKECDPASGCCPSDAKSEVEQDKTPASGCCPPKTPSAVEQDKTPASGCCPPKTPSAVEQDKTPASGCCPSDAKSAVR